MKPNIAFDIDGIVANFSDGYLKWVKQEYDLTFTSTDEFNWISDQDVPMKTFKRLIAEFIRDHSYLISPLKDGQRLVDYLWERATKPITFVTARDLSTIQATHAWIRRHFPHIDFVCITVDSGNAKWRYLEDFDCFIDDRRKTCIDLASTDKLVFMPARKYNTIIGNHAETLVNNRKIQLALPDDVWIPTRSITIVKDCDEILDNNLDDVLFK